MVTKSEKYSALAPRMEYLSDVIVLSQAWKKTHTYVRHHNWYADTLELDCSAVSLEENLSQWSSELQSGEYLPNPARVVPAPKSEPWIFDKDAQDGWAPEAPPDERFLRPLAHIGIREQTIASAAMLCLADCVESAQGDTSADTFTHKVYNYGNRLFCSWDTSRRVARFPWGNSNTYSRYFQDYQNFVDRPLKMAQKAVVDGQEPSSLYVIKLDLSAFYDNVNIPALIARLKKLYRSYAETIPGSRPADAAFWSTLERSLSIGWLQEDEIWAPYLKGGKLPSGLPQGLVASGFFANAYLLDFDEAVGGATRAIRQRRNIRFRVHDYCRYVDDLRLVVSCDATFVNETLLGAAVTDWVQELLEATVNDSSFVERLIVNGKKTELELFSSLGGESGTAARMKSLQAQLSGPFDIAALQHVEAGLNGLLAQAELGMTKRRAVDDSVALPALASIARQKHEVRDDTLTRFSAYRLTKALRLRRTMTDLTDGEDAQLSKAVLLHDFEVAARRLLAAWSLNPGLAQVLTYALDLYPSPDLLKSVTEALLMKIHGERTDVYATGVAFYTLAQLFRASAAQTGKRWGRDEIFKVGDVPAYRTQLGDLARNLLQDSILPWYVAQQALLLLAALDQSVSVNTIDEQLEYHRCLHGFLSGRVVDTLSKVEDTVAVSLVGQQLLGDETRYAKWFIAFAEPLSRKERLVALELIAQNQSSLLKKIQDDRGDNVLTGEQAFESMLRRYASARQQDDDELPANGEWVAFDTVVTNRQTPFHQENALLQLAYVLAEAVASFEGESEVLTPQSVELRCEDWSQLNDPTGVARLAAKIRPRQSQKDPRYMTPPWCDNDDAYLYAIGRLLRCAATGELDFTARQWVLRDDNIGWYQGVSSTWQKRQVGLLHTSVAMAGTTGAITQWFSELLLHLLRWPGLQAQMESTNSAVAVENVVDLQNIVARRLKTQAAIFGRRSKLPVYLYPVEWPIRDTHQLRVCVLQGLLPVTTDFNDGLAGLDAAGFRTRHRSHTAAILNLAYNKIQARDSALGREGKPYVDLVVLPEYSIHPDDQDLIRAFSDATGAMLFYGLCGARHPITDEPINAARWLVPQRRAGGRSWVEVDQGKNYPTAEEVNLGVKPWRPYQVVIELQLRGKTAYRISGAICYDATDISLAADLRDVTHMFIVSAMNKDVKTFDSMVAMLRYHMYQHVLVANAGEFGGSTAQAPYDQEHRRLISHSHGSAQIAINIFDVDMNHFGPELQAAEAGANGSSRIGKTPPAGLKR